MMQAGRASGRNGGLRAIGTAMLLAAAALVLGGCNNNKLSMDDLLRENEELRDRNMQIERALNDSESARAQLENERDGLLSENDRLRAARPASGGTTGFEGVSGAAVFARGGEIAVEVAGDVLFDSGSVVLKASAKQTLDQIASVIQSRYSGNQIRVAGHTDNDPIRKSGWKTNERLSAERALAVQEYLVSRGINKDRMYVAAYGPSRPKATKRESRRVEIVIIGTGS